MSLSLKRRGRNWYAVGQVHARRINQSLNTKDRTVAEALKRDLELKILSGGRLGKFLWTKYRDEFLAWIAPQIRGGTRSTLAKYTFIVQRFSRFLADHVILELTDIKPGTITEFVEERRRDVHPTRKNTVGPEGIKSDLRILHRVFAYAEECGYLTENPVRFKRLGVSGGKTLPFTDDELAAMLQDDEVSRSPILRAIILSFLFTGLRISDVMRFPLTALDLKHNRMILKTQKRGKIVSLAIHPEWKSALEVHLSYRNKAQHASPYVFSTDRGKPMLNLDARLRMIFRRCKIEHGHAHRFRDTFAVRLLAQGASLYDVSKMLGIDIDTAERHYSPYVKELQERGANLIAGLSVPGFASDSPKSSHTPSEEKVVQFCTPVGTTLGQIGDWKVEYSIINTRGKKP
jgi:integrase/recombinase XerC